MTGAGAPAGGLTPRAPAAPLLATAVLLALAYPPFHLVLPSFVALVPLAVWVARLAPGAEGRLDALRGGFLAGLAAFGLLLHWLATGLVAHSLLAVPAYLAAVAVLASLTAAAAVGIHATVSRLRWPVWLALPVFWTATEWARAHMGDLSFPWMQLGDSLTGWPRLVGAADVVGSRGLSFWLALVAGLLAEAVLRWRPSVLEPWLPSPAARPGVGPTGGGGRGHVAGGAVGRGRAWRPVAAAALVLAVPIAYSVHRWTALELEPAARVTVVQPDVAPELKLVPSEAERSARASVARLLDGPLAAAGGARDLVVLPETVVPEPLDPAPAADGPAAGRDAAGAGGDRDGRHDAPAWIDGLAARLNAPVLFGAPGLRTGRGGEMERYNEAFLRGPDGRWLGRYAKRRLVPGAEAVPFVDATVLRDRFSGRVGEGFGGFAAGPGPELLAAGSARFGVLVCYESIFSGLSRAHRRRGADFLVNVTNDAWFGRDEPAWMRTAGLWQHPAHLVMRAVETRTGVVRSANTGISGLVDPLGRQTHRTPLFEPAAFSGTVLTTPGRTLFVRWGDVPGRAAALVAVGAVIGALLSRPRPPPSAG